MSGGGDPGLAAGLWWTVALIGFCPLRAYSVVCGDGSRDTENVALPCAWSFPWCAVKEIDSSPMFVDNGRSPLLPLFQGITVGSAERVLRSRAWSLSTFPRSKRIGHNVITKYFYTDDPCVLQSVYEPSALESPIRMNGSAAR